MTIRKLYKIADELGLLDQRLHNIRCSYAELTKEDNEFQKVVTIQFWDGTQLAYMIEDEDEADAEH